MIHPTIVQTLSISDQQKQRFELVIHDCKKQDQSLLVTGNNSALLNHFGKQISFHGTKISTHELAYQILRRATEQGLFSAKALKDYRPDFQIESDNTKPLQNVLQQFLQTRTKVDQDNLTRFRSNKKANVIQEALSLIRRQASLQAEASRWFDRIIIVADQQLCINEYYLLAYFSKEAWVYQTCNRPNTLKAITSHTIKTQKFNTTA